jgi:hypothetical protein
VARVLDHLTISGDEEHLQPHINTRRFAGGWEWLCGNVSALEDGIPTVCLMRDGDGLGRACQGA